MVSVEFVEFVEKFEKFRVWVFVNFKRPQRPLF